MKRAMLMTSATVLAMMMAADAAALYANLADDPVYLTKDAAPSLQDVADAQTKFAEAFEAFKSKNDQAIDEAKKGLEDAVTKDELQKLTDQLLDLKAVRDDLDALAKKMSRPGNGPAGEPAMTAEQKEHKEAFLAVMRAPEDEVAKQTLQAIQKKAVSTGTDAGGGYGVPEVIASEVQRNLADNSNLESIVGVVQAGSKDYKELIDLLGLGYGWVGEAAARTETGTPQLAQAVPTFGTLYAYPKASEESLDDIFFDVESWLVTSIVEGHERGRENAIVKGNGVNKPTGFLNGVPTAEKDADRAYGVLQKIASGTADAIADSDKLIDLVQSLKSGYRANARFLMNRATVGQVMKLKDGDGDYLWKMGDIKSGQPDRLLGYSIFESEEMPDIAANALPIAFGDFNAGYLLCPLVGFRMTKDDNITEPGFVKWYARQRIGGCIRKSEAIKLLSVEA